MIRALKFQSAITSAATPSEGTYQEPMSPAGAHRLLLEQGRRNRGGGGARGAIAPPPQYFKKGGRAPLNLQPSIVIIQTFYAPLGLIMSQYVNK